MKHVGLITLGVCHLPVLQVPDESQCTLRFEDSSEFLRSVFVVWAPMERLPTAFDLWFPSEHSESAHLSYYNEIRRTVLGIDPCERSFRDRHTIVFGLLREYGSHPRTRIIRFQRLDGGPFRPVWVSEESSCE